MVRIAVGAELAEAEPVPPAVTADREHARSGARQHGLSRRGTGGRPGRHAGRRLPGREERGGKAACKHHSEAAEPHNHAHCLHGNHRSRASRSPLATFTERFHRDSTGNLLRCSPRHACPDRHPPAPLPRRPPDRARRHGRDLLRHRQRARARGRAEGARGPLRREQAVTSALRTRGTRSRAPLGDTPHRHHLRRHRARRPPDHRHGVPVGGLAGGADRGHALPTCSGTALARRGRRRSRRGARRGRRAPRCEAGKPAARWARLTPCRRLRRRERGRTRFLHADGDDSRHGGLSLPGAGTGPACRSGERPLLPRSRRVGAAHGPTPVCRRLADDRGARARQRAGALTVASEPGAAAPTRPDLRTRAREGPGRAICDCRRVRRRPAPCTRRRGRRHVDRAPARCHRGDARHAGRRAHERTPVATRRDRRDPARCRGRSCTAGVSLGRQNGARAAHGRAHGHDARSNGARDGHDRAGDDSALHDRRKLGRRGSAEQRRLHQDAGGRLQWCAATTRPGRAEARRQRLPRRGVRQVQPRVHALHPGRLHRRPVTARRRAGDRGEAQGDRSAAQAGRAQVLALDDQPTASPRRAAYCSA